MASLDFDQKFLGRIAKQTEDTSPFLSSALYQILGLSVLLARRLIRARKLRKLDTSRDTPSLSTYQHILWMSREGLSILELYVLPCSRQSAWTRVQGVERQVAGELLPHLLSLPQSTTSHDNEHDKYRPSKHCFTSFAPLTTKAWQRTWS